MEILNTGVSIETRPSTQACLWPCENRARIPPTQALIKHHGRATWPWSSLYQNNTGIRHARVEEPWANLIKQHGHSTRPRGTPVVEPVKLTQAWGLHTRAWEKLIHQLSIPEFDAALGLYTKEFKEENELHALSHHINFSPSKCWHTLAPSAASYNPSRSKASVLPPSLRVRHRPCLFHRPCDSAPDGAALEGGHLHWPLRDLTGATLQAPQHCGISSMLSMRMIERRRGTYPLQYHLAQSTEEEAYEDIPDDVPPQHEDPPTQPPPPSSPVHAAASYADISECLT
ncbi:hypothetical protein GOBAR_AA25490 [Gossypium barbadense]|uniref:Uncharacterized protein n=1 Tax=Gossypium barbadense TaxID=3634 RepID=A0A2P5WVQ5_GOSBA|nr:hypothetical protein GOBAR_AA25490 [Gossypium barbadense]